MEYWKSIKIDFLCEYICFLVGTLCISVVLLSCVEPENQTPSLGHEQEK